MFSIYSDRSYLASPSTPHAAILAPFWGPNPEAPPDTGRFDRYAKVGAAFLRMSTLDGCDVGVFPQNWESAGERALPLGEAFVTACRDAGKPPVFFSGADPTDPLPIDATVFRTSLVRSRQLPNEFALPAWSEDFMHCYLGGELRPRPKHAPPLVGFCGNTLAALPPTTVRGKVGHLLGRRQPEHPRKRALQALEREPRIETNFIVRGTFWAEAFSDVAALTRARREYVQNMLESDYVLCVRGIGNFSYRLYETLSVGRIPIFVDTDCVLPLDFEIDWRDYCVWVEESEIERIGERVLEFHESLGDGEFEELQRACRGLWESHISPQGFFASFHRHFETA